MWYNSSPVWIRIYDILKLTLELRYQFSIGYVFRVAMNIYQQFHSNTIDPIYHGCIWFDSAHNTTITKIKLLSDWPLGMTLHTSPLRTSYGVSAWVIRRKITTIYQERTVFFLDVRPWKMIRASDVINILWIQIKGLLRTLRWTHHEYWMSPVLNMQGGIQNHIWFSHCAVLY